MDDIILANETDPPPVILPQPSTQTHLPNHRLYHPLMHLPKQPSTHPPTDLPTHTTIHICPPNHPQISPPNHPDLLTQPSRYSLPTIQIYPPNHPQISPPIHPDLLTQPSRYYHPTTQIYPPNHPQISPPNHPDIPNHPQIYPPTPPQINPPTHPHPNHWVNQYYHNMAHNMQENPHIIMLRFLSQMQKNPKPHRGRSASFVVQSIVSALFPRTIYGLGVTGMQFMTPEHMPNACSIRWGHLIGENVSDSCIKSTLVWDNPPQVILMQHSSKLIWVVLIWIFRLRKPLLSQFQLQWMVLLRNKMKTRYVVLCLFIMLQCLTKLIHIFRLYLVLWLKRWNLCIFRFRYLWELVYGALKFS